MTDTNSKAQVVEAMAKAMCERDGFAWWPDSCLQTANGEEPEEQREYWRDKADAALAAQEKPEPGVAVPAGWKLVPVEPTPEMYGAGGVQQFKNDCAMTPVREAVGLVYRAMLAVAPPPDLPEGEVEKTSLSLTLTRALGMYGSAYDQPGPHRAYTYQHQPSNQPAYRLGKVASVLYKGDHIDRGLYLLKALEENGFGVFEIDKLVEPSSMPADDPTSPPPIDKGEVK